MSIGDHLGLLGIPLGILWITFGHPLGSLWDLWAPLGTILDDVCTILGPSDYKKGPQRSKRVPREPKRVSNRLQHDTKMLPELIIMIFDMPKSACSTPVHRILVQNQHVRRLCSGFWSQKAYFHEQVILCDACRADLGSKILS